MNKKFVLLAFASVLLLSAVIGAQLMVAVAALRTVGVSPGEWAEYAWTYSGNATMPTPDKMIEWTQIIVQKISGTNITFKETIRYADHHEETTINIVDVNIGQGNGSGTFIAANLNAGDFIYNSTDPSVAYYGMTINETISRPYVDEIVTVNHFNIMMNQTIPFGGTQTMSINSYWYRATGMTAEYSAYQLFQPSVGNTTWFKMEAVIIDIISEFPPALILPIFMVITITAVWLGKTIWSTKKLIKKPSHCA